MAKEYEAEEYQFVFAYTRDAHSGENFPGHRNLKQKLSHALSLKERWQIKRSILVDDLIGAGHKLYGGSPNMTYVVSRSGRILFRFDYSVPTGLTRRPSRAPWSIFSRSASSGGKGCA